MRVDTLQANDTITENGERVYSPNHKPSPADIGALPAAGTASNSNALGGKEIAEFGTGLKSISFGGDGSWTTVQFLDWLDTHGAFDNASWVSRGSWSYASNRTITDSGLGNIHLAGAVVEAFGSRNNCTIRVTTPSTTSDSGKPNACFTYVNNGSAYAPGWRVDYNSKNKPTAVDVGARPANWVPSWNDVSSKPVQATRWPTWAEVSGKPGTMPPSSHTHPWSQITGEPVYTQRWPNWNEVSGKPGNLLTQTTADTRYMRSNARPDADTLDGQDSGFYRQGEAVAQRAITVGGNANTYYPVLIGGTAQYNWSRFGISRRYGDTAPNSWNTATHKGGLTFTWEASGDSGWGGNDHNYRVLEFSETYSSMVAGMVLSVSGMIVWLRGGGAKYYVTGPKGASTSVSVYIGNYTSADKKVWVPRTNVNAKTAEILNRQFARGTGQLYDTGSRVYSDQNKPSPSTLGIYSKSEGDARYIRFGYAGNSSYATLTAPKSTWIRSPSSGFLPYTNGHGSLGTSSWNWSAVYANAVYDGNQRVYSPRNKPSLSTLGAQAALSADRRRRITYGTGNPSGGSDGDIYIQYK